MNFVLREPLQPAYFANLFCCLPVVSNFNVKGEGDDNKEMTYGDIWSLICLVWHLRTGNFQ